MKIWQCMRLFNLKRLLHEITIMPITMCEFIAELRWQLHKAKLKANKKGWKGNETTLHHTKWKPCEIKMRLYEMKWRWC